MSTVLLYYYVNKLGINNLIILLKKFFLKEIGNILVAQMLNYFSMTNFIKLNLYLLSHISESIKNKGLLNILEG